MVACSGGRGAYKIGLGGLGELLLGVGADVHIYETVSRGYRARGHMVRTTHQERGSPPTPG